MPDETEALATLIEDLRDELETEIPTRLHEDSGEPMAEWSEVMPKRGMNGRASSGWTGLPFTQPFLRYLGHPENYGYEFIAAASFEEIAAYCRSHHDESHSAGGANVSLCRRLAVAVVEFRQPVSFVAAVEDLGIFAVRKHLMDVLTHAAEWRGKKRELATFHDQQKQESQDPSDPIGVMLAREHQEAREQRTWNLLRLRHPEMSPWELERERRAEKHRRLGCGQCLQEVA